MGSAPEPDREPNTEARVAPGVRLARALVPILLLLASMLAAPPAAAQLDRLIRMAKELEEFEARYRYGRLSLPDFDTPQRRIAVTDGFSIAARPKGKRLTLRSDSAVIWLDPNSKFSLSPEKAGRNFVPRPFYEGQERQGRLLDIRAVLGIYAEGDVFLQVDDHVLRAERLFYDTVLDRIVIVDGFASGLLTQAALGPPIPFYVRAEELRLELMRGGEDPASISRSLVKLRARNCSATTCDYGIPHYHVHASEIRVDPDEDDYVSVAVTDATLNVREIPVFYLPYLWGRSSILEYFPLRSVSGGTRSRFGTYVYTEWGDDIRMRDRDGRRRTWGSWTLHLDNRTRRGPAAGLDIDYRTEDYRGSVTGYYTRDRGTDTARGVEFDPPDNDRGRFRSFHRQELPAGLQLDVETAWIRDRNFLYEYFEGEARTDKIQENYVRLARDWDNTSFRLLVRPRVNDFYTRVEYLPRLSGEIFSQPIVPGGFLGTNLYVDAAAEATKARLRFDEALNLPDLPTDRAGAAATFELPVRAGPLHLTPFFSGSYTGYSATLNGDEPDGRHLWTAGFRAHTQFWKVYPEALFGMDLRHLVQPQVLYTNTFDASLAPYELIPLDQTELAGEFEAFTVRLQNKLQVKPGRDVMDVFELNLENVLYPDEDRDNAGEAVGPLFADLKAGVAPFLLLADGLYDWKESDLLVGNVGVLSALGRVPGVPRSNAALYLGHRFAKRISDVFTASLRTNLGEKWSVGAFFQYDYRGDRVLNQRYMLGRTFHRFRLELEFYDDGSSGDHGFRIAFAPVEYFQRAQRDRRRFEEGQFIGDY